MPSMISIVQKRERLLAREKEKMFLKEQGIQLGLTTLDKYQMWFGLQPLHFLQQMEKAKLEAPSTKLHQASHANFLTPVGKLPAVAMVEPSYATGYYWVGVKVDVPNPPQVHVVKTSYYPTVVAVGDIPSLLRLWKIDNLKWSTHTVPPIWAPDWSVLRRCVPTGDVTCFVVSEDRKYIMFTRAYGVAVGRKMNVLIQDAPEVKTFRIGICRREIYSMVEKFRRHGLSHVASNEATLKTNAYGLYHLPEDEKARAKVLNRVAQYSAINFRKWIIEGERNLLEPYVGGPESKTVKCALCGASTFVLKLPAECSTCGEAFPAEKGKKTSSECRKCCGALLANGTCSRCGTKPLVVA